uniref:Uncharacterized protein n=1 Tax=Stegastes partitus TaxID=144197 RepID=A0A3B4YYZ4_9TELE
MEAIISAAETGFTGSLVGSSPEVSVCCSVLCVCVQGLTMLRVSMPRQQSRALLQWEPPHWYRRPRASWMSCSCSQTLPLSELVVLFVGAVLHRRRRGREHADHIRLHGSVAGSESSRLHLRQRDKTRSETHQNH